MTTAALIALDQILVVLTGAAWCLAGGYALTSRTAVAAGLTGSALLATAGRVATAVALAGHGWWFAGEKVLLALPLLLPPALLTATRTLPHLIRTTFSSRAPRPGSAARLWPLAAAYAALAGVFVSLVVGYPISPYLALVVVAAVAGAMMATWSMLSRGAPPGRSWRVAGSVLAALAVAWTGLSMWNARPVETHLAAAGGVDLTRLHGPERATRTFTLTARPATLALASGRTVPALTFNGTVPGPPIRVRQGEVVEVRLRNELPDRGVTLHWHGYHVPNAEDGVPGLTQQAVRRGGEHVYRFRADQPGSYWYHTHETPNAGLQRGLFGTFIVDPAPPRGFDQPVVLHTFAGTVTAAVGAGGPSDVPQTAPVSAGTPVRLRVVNTDNGPHVIGLSGVPYRISAIDGTDVNGRTLGAERAQLAAGGRYDLSFTMPRTPVVLAAGERAALLLTPGSGAAPPPAGGPLLDLTQYASRQTIAPARFDRDYTWVLDRLVALRGGLPMLSHTVNGEVWPRIQAPVVAEGEWVRFTVVNRSRELHPMHPHGHHVLVLSRDGVPAAPYWTDSFDVAPGEVWEVALKAENPGVWLSHCHELSHAAEGMTLHFAYAGVRSPFAIGPAEHPD